MERKLLTNGKAFQRTDGKWQGTVWYMDEYGERKRKSFAGSTQRAVNKKMKDYIEDFKKNREKTRQGTDYPLMESLEDYIQIFKFPNVERATYDRCEYTAESQIFPRLGTMAVGDITAADVQKLLNDLMTDGYSFSTVKKVYNLLTEFYRHQKKENIVSNNPMEGVTMLKRTKFISAQGKEVKPMCEEVQIFTPEEIEIIRTEAFSTFSDGTRKYQQAAAYFLMLNTGLRTGEILGLKNSDIDLENRMLHVRRAAKEVSKRDGAEKQAGWELIIGKPKSATSIRDIPLNETAIEMIKDLREEKYFGEDSPLIPDENGQFTKPSNFRKRFYRILEACGVKEKSKTKGTGNNSTKGKTQGKGLHSLRHTFATTLINGIKQPDGTVKNLPIKQVADILGHTTTEITELYYVKRESEKLNGVTDGFDL